jgi:hypothetical protein
VSATAPIPVRMATAHSGGTLATITLLTGQVKPHAKTTVTSRTSPTRWDAADVERVRTPRGWAGPRWR